MKFSKLVEHVSKKPLPSHTKHLIVEVMVSDEDDEDVEVRSHVWLTLRYTANCVEQVPFIVVFL